MQIVSINVSGVREVDDGGRRVRTAIFKRPVDGPVRVRRLNLDGDDQADRTNHGGEHKAVYAFGQQHLPHWREALGRDDVGPGFFGENLSVDVLDEGERRIGDRLRVGDCLLEITQPRVPCFKLGLRAADRALPRAFVAHGRTGAYLRVLEEGELRRGDALVLERREPAGNVAFESRDGSATVVDRATSGAAATSSDGGPVSSRDASAKASRPPAPTLAELFAAAYHRDHPAPRPVLAAALAEPALSEEWYAIVVERLRRLDGVG